MQRFCKFGNTIFQKGSSLIQSIGNIAIHEPRSVFATNYCEIRCMYDDDFNTSDDSKCKCVERDEMIDVLKRLCKRMCYLKYG